MGLSLAQFRTKGNELGFTLLPLKDIHLRSFNNFELEAGGDEKQVYIFGAIVKTDEIRLNKFEEVKRLEFIVVEKKTETKKEEKAH